jgi:cytochrome c553
MPKHIARLVLLLVTFGAAAYAAKVYFTADSFYWYGHYRGDSVAEIASEKPKYKGSDYCRSCHAERYAEWAKGVHYKAEAGKVVQCEACHGAAGGRARWPASSTRRPASIIRQRQAAGPGRYGEAVHALSRKMPGRPAGSGRSWSRRMPARSNAMSVTTHSPRIILESTPRRRKWGTRQPDRRRAARRVTVPTASVAIRRGRASRDKSAYLVDALEAYRTGARDNAMMTGIAKG